MLLNIFSTTFTYSNYLLIQINYWYNQLYVENMSRKISKVKANHLRHDPFISF